MCQKIFYNKIIDKSGLKSLIQHAFENYSVVKATKLVENFKKSGFYFSTKAGISIGIEDLKVPPIKKRLVLQNHDDMKLTYLYQKRGIINEVERFQNLIDTWQNTSELLKEQLISFFKTVDPLNSLYIMSFSGARGNLSQVRQLIGMRGLMSDPSGKIIEIPIQANFREGLTVTDYLISAYGARKGIVDTALKTANSGYLTRRLVDVAQHVIIREIDCKTRNGIRLEYNPSHTKLEKFLGRSIAKPIFQKNTSQILIDKDTTLTVDILNSIKFLTNIILRSPLICESSRSICQKCYGWDLAEGKLVELADSVGIIAAQSIGEPGTQLTMRTFHTGGVFTGEATNQLRSEVDGKILFSSNLETCEIRNIYGNNILKAVNNSFIFILVDQLRLIKIPIMPETLIYCKNKSFIARGGILLEFAKDMRRSIVQRKTITTDSSGEVQFQQFLSNQINTNGSIVWVATGDVYSMQPNMLLKTSASRIVKNNSVAQTKLAIPLNGLIRKKNFGPRVKMLLLNCFIVFPFKYFYQKDQAIFLNINKTYNFKVIPESKSQSFGIRKTKKYSLPITYQFFCSKLDRNSNLYNSQIFIISPKYPKIFLASNKSQILFKIKNNKLNKELFTEKLIFPGEIISTNTNLIENKRLRHCILIDSQTTKLLFYLRPLTQCNVTKQLDSPLLNIQRGLNIFNRQVGLVTKQKYNSGSWVNSHQSFIKTNLTFLKRPKTVEFYLTRKNLAETKDTQRLISYALTYKIPVKLSTGEADRTQLSLMYQILQNQYVDLCSTLVTLNSVIGDTITIESLKTLRHNSNRLLLTSKENYKTYHYKNNKAIVDSKFILVGDKIGSDQFANYSGYNTSYKKSTSNSIIKLRLSTPFFISSGAKILINHGTLITKGDPICELSYNRILNNDIVSGLPRVERLLEARVNKDKPKLVTNPCVVKEIYPNRKIRVLERQGDKVYNANFDISVKKGEILFVGQPIDKNIFDSHNILTTYFKYYCSLYTAKRAALLSITNIQVLILNLVQDVYKSQGVNIADKHIEIILKQITSKVKILHFNIDTFFIPTEYMEFDQVQYINSALKYVKKPLIEYKPVLVGITKVSLMTESFISAASFQETKKVLAQAAVEGRVEWLRGLKENVILGRLIPAGTGFKSFSTTSLLNVRLKNSLKK